jgi:aspartate aminotransferase-like enzyme
MRAQELRVAEWPRNTAGRPLLAFRSGPYLFKQAESAAELDAVHVLNHRTFAAEIPQHAPQPDGRLVDKFHARNLYIVAKRDARVVAMVAVHDQPPFSVADRLSNPAALLHQCPQPLEVRLLAIAPGERHSVVFVGLLWCVLRYAQAAGYSHLVISGVQERVFLYERFGFVALGPAMQSGAAWFVPMMLPLDQLPVATARTARRWEQRAGLPVLQSQRRTVSLLPGPVEVAPHVAAAYCATPTSHRSDAFVARYNRVRQVLSDMVGGHGVALLVGSGTLANEAVAAAIAARHGRAAGLVLSNGEFGRRLADLAARWGLRFRMHALPWGDAYDAAAVAQSLRSGASPRWIWAVHSESSTGVINDLDALRAAAQACDVPLFLDAVSSIGAVPIDLRGVTLASGTSGKALGAYAGVAMVLADPALRSAVHRWQLPAYLDVGRAFDNTGPAFTFSTPLLAALEAALDDYRTPLRRQARFAHYAALGRMVRTALGRLGYRVLAPERHASPVLTTFSRVDTPAGHLGLLCRALGYEINTLSHYLVERDLAQIATMGAVSKASLQALLTGLAGWEARVA